MEKERLLQVTNIPHMPGNDPAAPNNKLQPQDSKSTICASQLGQTILFPKQTRVYSFSLDCRNLLIGQAPMLGTKNA